LSAIAQGVVICKGSWFIGEGIEKRIPTNMFFRATFAAASAEKMKEAIERFGLAIKGSFGVRN